jgi:hypothetical protein
VLGIRIGFNADANPDPAVYLIADQDPGSQTNSNPDPDPGQTLPSQKGYFYMKNLLYVKKRSKMYLPF